MPIELTPQTKQQAADAVSELCKTCGLCCTGHVFPRARTFKQEIPLLEELHLETTYDSQTQKHWFSLPCPHWNEKCGTYDHRPSTCRSFVCNLVVKLKSQSISLQSAQSLTTSIKSLGNMLRQEIMPDVPARYFDRNRLQKWIQEDPPSARAGNPKLFIDAVAYERAVSTHLHSEQTTTVDTD